MVTRFRIRKNIYTSPPTSVWAVKRPSHLQQVSWTIRSSGCISSSASPPRDNIRGKPFKVALLRSLHEKSQHASLTYCESSFLLEQNTKWNCSGFLSRKKKLESVGLRFFSKRPTCHLFSNHPLNDTHATVLLVRILFDNVFSLKDKLITTAIIF